jgi:phosphatidylinositol-3-phosphatase
MRFLARSALCAASVLLLAACASSSSTLLHRTGRVTTRVGQPAPAAPSKRPDHIVVIVMENKEYDSIIGSSSAPYINKLARRFVLLTQEFAVSHPSLPNYLALTGGSTFGISSDCTSCHVHGRNLVDQLERKGLTWKAYMQSMPSTCFTGSFAGTSPGDYAKKHDPFIYYDDVRNDPKRCANIVPFTVLKRHDLKAGLPDFVWITPNECHDMHDCSVRTGDDFLRQWVPKLIAHVGRDGIVIVTFDEGSSNAGCCSLGSAGGHVATIIAGPGAGTGVQLKADADHYSLLRLIEDAWGLPRMRHAGDRSTPTIRGYRG